MIELETVLDRVIHLDEPLVAEIPKVPRQCDQIGTLKKQSVNIGDCKLYVEREGVGIPIVLINGGPGGTHHGFHPCFSEAAKFAQVIYYDQRGCGLSDYAKGANGYTFSQAIDDLEKLRKALKIDRWVVVGFSYGGQLAQNYLLNYPERTAGLVLVGAANAVPLSLNGTRQYDYLTNAERKKISETYNNRQLTDQQQLFNAHMYGDWKRQNFYRPTKEQLARMTFYEWKHAKDFRNGIGGSMKLIDVGVFDKCPVPVLITEGKWDLTWNTDKAEKLHGVFPGSKLVMFERAGHSVFEDEPEKFFATLKEFVKNLPKVKDEDMALWKTDVENGKKRMLEEAKNVSNEVTFRTSEKAPEGFNMWTFFWTSPDVAEDAKVGYLVQYDGGQEYFKGGPNKINSGGSLRSDFTKDSSVLYDKTITVKFWTTKGKIRFPEGMQLKFEFCDRNGKVTKEMHGLKVEESSQPANETTKPKEKTR